MRNTLFTTALIATLLFDMPSTLPGEAKDKTIASPNNQLVVTLTDNDGRPSYAIKFDGIEVMRPSQLGLVTDITDPTQGMTLTESPDYTVRIHYD